MSVKQTKKEILTINDICKKYDIKEQEFKNKPPEYEDISSPFDNHKKFGVKINGIGGLI